MPITRSIKTHELYTRNDKIKRKLVVEEGHEYSVTVLQDKKRNQKMQ